MERYLVPDAIGLIRFQPLDRVEGVDHAFETRAGRLCRRLDMPIARLRQVHGRTVHVLDPRTDLYPYLHGALESRPAGDALVTGLSGIAIAVATADCVPVLIASPRGVVAAVHAGWRGIAAGVLGATVESMRRHFGCEMQTMVAAVGPCIGRASYRVGNDVVKAFADAGVADDVFTDPRAEGAASPTWSCDLAVAAYGQLLAAALLARNVHTSGLCTHSNPRLFHSYRRDGETAGRMLAGIVRLPTSG